jgi:hypothetical protein
MPPAVGSDPSLAPLSPEREITDDDDDDDEYLHRK